MGRILEFLLSGLEGYRPCHTPGVTWHWSSWPSKYNFSWEIIWPENRHITLLSLRGTKKYMFSKKVYSNVKDVTLIPKKCKTYMLLTSVEAGQIAALWNFSATIPLPVKSIPQTRYLELGCFITTKDFQTYCFIEVSSNTIPQKKVW